MISPLSFLSYSPTVLSLILSESGTKCVFLGMHLLQYNGFQFFFSFVVSKTREHILNMVDTPTPQENKNRLFNDKTISDIKISFTPPMFSPTGQNVILWIGFHVVGQLRNV